VREFLESFVGETKGELFPTREACVEFYERDGNFRKLEQGEIGDNLMYRYRAIASFHVWDEICETAMNATRRLLEERGIASEFEDFDAFWEDFHTYVRLTHASGRDKETILASVAATLRYDIARWLAEENLGDPRHFRLPEPIQMEFRLSEESRRELESALAVWTTHIKGLSKMVTRIKMDCQIRQCVPIGDRSLAAHLS
jgi:hypothetical protein